MNDMSPQQWDQRYSTSEYVWTATANHFVEWHLSGLAPGAAIDLAAGEGRNSVWLAQQGWKVTAVDFSQIALDKALELAERHDVEIEVACDDATSYTPDHAVDLVLVVYLQLSQQARVTALAHAASWVKPGGTLFVCAHDRSNVTEGWGGPPDIDVCYDLDETVDLLNGFDIKVAEVAHRQVHSDTTPHIALDTLVVAMRSTM